MDIKTCPKCSAQWINGQLFWYTGKSGNEEDLAGLVCNNYGNSQCINRMKGVVTGDTWEKRLKDLEKLEDGMLE